MLPLGQRPGFGEDKSMLCRLSLAFVMMLIATVSSYAQGQPQRPPHPGYQGTALEQNACEAPAQKYCRAAMPDQFRVLQCLQANRARIGKACQAVLTAYGQ
jgi:hypothetical protein